MEGLPPHAKGLMLVVGGVLLLTPDALLIRLIAIDHWNLLVWRGFLQALSLSLILLALYGRGTPAAFRAAGRRAVLGGVVVAMSTICFIVALSYTTVTNVLVIVAAAPFFAAVTSRIFLGEAVRRYTWAAIALALGGIALLALGSLGGQPGGARPDALWGDLLALCGAIGLGSNFTILRHGRAVNMLPAMVLGGLLSGGIALVFAPAIGLDPSQMVLLLLMGVVASAIPFALITTGLRYLTAPEAGLLMLLETVLGPFWVWLVIGETPARLALAGGAIVVATLVGHSLLSLRQQGR